MSKTPFESAEIFAACSTTSIISGETVTGPFPAARFTFVISLESL